MKSASIRDLRTKTSELVRDAAAGEIIVIKRRGEPVAELRPIAVKPIETPKGQNKFLLPDMTEIWSTFPQLPGDSTRFIEEDRDR